MRASGAGLRALYLAEFDCKKGIELTSRLLGNSDRVVLSGSYRYAAVGLAWITLEDTVGALVVMGRTVWIVLIFVVNPVAKRFEPAKTSYFNAVPHTCLCL